jgi:prepilin-type N-terminal cleavage/methylation domain-containing protein
MSNAGSEVRGRGSAGAGAPKSPGFTLLEVLIAVAIMSMIVTVIYTSFFTASRNVEQAEAIRDSTDLARTLVAKLSSDISNAYLNPYMNASVVTTIFYGKKVQPETETGLNKSNRHDSLSLTPLTNWRRPDSKETDLWEVGYNFKQKPDGSGWVLMRREKRELSNDFPALEGGVEYEMTDHVVSLQFRYNDGFTWVDEWDSRSRQKLPSIVEITLLLDDGSAYITQVDVGR